MFDRVLYTSLYHLIFWFNAPQWTQPIRKALKNLFSEIQTFPKNVGKILGKLSAEKTGIHIINFNFFIDIFQNPDYKKAQNYTMKSKKVHLGLLNSKYCPISSFHANGFLLYPLKTSKDQGFFIFSGGIERVYWRGIGWSHSEGGEMPKTKACSENTKKTTKELHEKFATISCWPI